MASVIYRQNNVLYRIATSKAIAGFKHNQALVLNELVSNKFSPHGKELILLAYDSWYGWINHVETLCFGQTFTQDMIATCKNSAKDVASDFLKTIHSNPQVFPPNVAVLWEKIHDPAFPYMMNRLFSCVDLSCAEAFTLIVHSISEILNSTLFEMQELDQLDREGPMFISLDNLSLEIYKHTGFSLPLHKFLLYSVDRDKEVVIKMYADRKNQDVRTDQLVMESTIRPIEDNGGTIVRCE